MKRIVGCLIALVCLLPSPELFSQAAGFEQSRWSRFDGARVPGAEVTINSESRGAMRSVISNEVGIFRPMLVLVRLFRHGSALRISGLQRSKSHLQVGRRSV
jgi:hypothetical protein